VCGDADLLDAQKIQVEINKLISLIMQHAERKKTYTENTEDSICTIFFRLVRFEFLETMLPNIQVS
jgi:hypothetical protein